jgi:hypothetical protein
MTPDSGAPSAPLAGVQSRAAPLRAALVAAVLPAVLLATQLGSPSPRYLADPALARLLRAMGMLKGLIAVGAIAALWWRAAWPVPVRLAVAAVAAVSVQVVATVWIVRLVAIAWAAGLFHVGLAALLLCVWLEHRGEAGRRA